MKRVERLAEDWCERVRVDFALKQGLVADHRVAFEAGYRQAIEDTANSVGYLPGVGFHAAKKIRALPDQEDGGLVSS